MKVIADRLGHANPVVTMTTYAHLFDGIDVAGAERLDEAWTQSVTDPGRTRRFQGPFQCTGRRQKPLLTRGFLWWALLGSNQ